MKNELTSYGFRDRGMQHSQGMWVFLKAGTGTQLKVRKKIETIETNWILNSENNPNKQKRKHTHARAHTHTHTLTCMHTHTSHTCLLYSASLNQISEPFSQQTAWISEFLEDLAVLRDLAMPHLKFLKTCMSSFVRLKILYICVFPVISKICSRYSVSECGLGKKRSQRLILKDYSSERSSFWQMRIIISLAVTDPQFPFILLNLKCPFPHKSPTNLNANLQAMLWHFFLTLDIEQLNKRKGKECPKATMLSAQCRTMCKCGPCFGG